MPDSPARAGTELPTLLIDRHLYDLRRWLGVLRLTESKVIEDLLDGDGIVNEYHGSQTESRHAVEIVLGQERCSSTATSAP